MTAPLFQIINNNIIKYWNGNENIKARERKKIETKRSRYVKLHDIHLELIILLLYYL